MLTVNIGKMANGGGTKNWVLHTRYMYIYVFTHIYYKKVKKMTIYYFWFYPMLTTNIHIKIYVSKQKMVD